MSNEGNISASPPVVDSTGQQTLPVQHPKAKATEEGELPSSELQRSWFQNCFDTSNESGWGVHRYGNLALLNLCYYQYDFERLEKKIREAEGEVYPTDVQALRSLIKEYNQAAIDFVQLSQIRHQGFHNAVTQHEVLFPPGHTSHDTSFSTYSDFANLKVKAPEGDQVRAVLRKILPLKAVVSEDEAYIENFGPSTNPLANYTAALRAGAKQRTPFVDGLARVIVAITGGVFLLVPMIVMTFVHESRWRLVIVSIAVVWFAISVALASQASNQELLGATAAYTAVLVVYVGSTSGNG